MNEMGREGAVCKKFQSKSSRQQAQMNWGRSFLVKRRLRLCIPGMNSEKGLGAGYEALKAVCDSGLRFASNQLDMRLCLTVYLKHICLS